MIPYTLAKEMKEAGYPQKIGELGHWCTDCNDLPGMECIDVHTVEYLKFPTLEEVINVSGDRFLMLKSFYLTESSKIYEAIGGKSGSKDHAELISTTGPTPLIAACNLYLAINKSNA